MGDNAQRIAVVGMGGRFPGARNTDEFWANLLAGRESIVALNADQLRPYEPDIDRLMARADFVTARGMLDDVDLFDARFFGFAPREAATLDPQQRLWLESAWGALEQAGVDPKRFDGPIGVFAGAGNMEQYMLYHMLADRQAIENQVKLRTPEAFAAMIASGKDYLPSRTAYKFDLRGPAVNVQTACSTALVAVHMACQSLLAFESDIAIAGGVSIGLPQAQGYIAQEGGIRSLDGHCRPFDARACGTVFSSGLGVFVLKRYEDALTDGDEMLAVIRGSAINNDGADKVSYGAPSAAGQGEVVAMAQAVADVHPDEIGYVETHGTATPLGDPIEIDGLTQAWRRKSDAVGQVMLGSVKSNVGHLDAAAGAAGLIKTIQALRHGKIPATLHYSEPNPRIAFDGSPFRVAAQLSDWPADGLRVAGVSSFGVGGTNAHVVVEQAPAPQASVPAPGAAQLLVLSAKSAPALARRCLDLADWLEEHTDAPMADVAWTLAIGRAEMSHRVSVVAANASEAAQALRTAAKRAEQVAPTEADQPPVAFLFPGQGAQHPGMARALYERPGVFRDTIDRLAELLVGDLGVDIRTLLYPDTPDADADARLRDTGIAQPALFVVELALARLWAQWGIEPQAMLGHSVGEFVAACLAGVFTEAEACRILAVRAGLMADMPGGSMLAVRRSEADVAPLLSDEIALAAVNGPALCIVSGPDAAIDALAGRLADDGEEPIRLHTSHAFHSPMMDGVLEPFMQTLRQAALAAPGAALVSCRTADWMEAGQATDPAYWADQLRSTVRFSPAFERLLEDPARVYIECGPSQNLSAVARQHRIDGRAPLCVASQGHAASETPADRAMLAAVGELWAAGVTPDWHGVFETETHPRRRVHLPTYPFERERHWIEPPLAAGVDRAAPAPVTSSGGHAIDTPETATAAAPPSLPPAGGSPPDRAAYLRDTLRDIFHTLSGITIGADEADRSFAALGMDSLFLTQVAAEISQRFEINLRFRQLLDELNTLARLGAHLDANLPAGRFEPPTAPAKAPMIEQTNGPGAPIPAGPIPVNASTSAGGGATERLIEQQLEIMRQQLAVLGGQGGQVGERGEAAPAVSSSPVVHARIDRAAQGRNLAATSADRFGPYKRINVDRDGGLDNAQQAFLDSLIDDLTRRTNASKRLAAKARRHLADPRGVANFRRSWKELVYQIAADRTHGARMIDIDGNEYIDITMGFGIGFLGHSHPVVVDAVQAQLQRGFETGPQTPLAPRVAEKFCRIVGQERVTFCNTGSEAVMAALRCARTVTGKNKIVYFTGDYHGTFDEVLGRAHLADDTLSTRPAAPGIVQASVDNAIVLDYGQPASLDIVRAHIDEIAAILVEPVQSRHPEVQPVEFVRELRRITAQSGAALILDEVITGFRCAPDGLNGLWGIDADMCTYGKIVGGGLPIGALAGKSRWLDSIDGGAWDYGDDSVPEAPMTFFAGTFVRHPLVMAAADAVLDFLESDGGRLQADLDRRTAAFADELNAFFSGRGVPVRIRCFSSWFRFDVPGDQPFVQLMFYRMLAEGIYIRDGGQNCFFSIAHSDADIARVAEVVRDSVVALQAAGFMPTVDAVAHDEAAAPARAVARMPRPRQDAPDGLAVGEAIDLTEAQREIWLAQAVRPEIAHAYNELVYLDLCGALEPVAFEAAVQAMAERHEALSLRFAGDGETQRRIDAVPIPVEWLDCRDAADPEADAMDAIQALGRMDFDLAGRDPLMRLRVCRIADTRHFAALVVHHLLCDGWSAVVLFADLAALYSARVDARPAELATPIPFSRYARAQFDRVQESTRQLAYWTALYADPPAPLALPTRAPRERADAAPAGNRLHDIPPALQAGVRACAARENATAFSVYMAAYAVLLCRLAGQSEVVIAMPVAGQALEGHDALVGHCVQLLPLRLSCVADEAFANVVVRVRDAITQACIHADCTYGQIIRALKLERDPARLPLAEVVFNFSPTGEPLKFSGLSADLHEAPKTQVNFDLHFNLTQNDDRLLLHCDYNADLFDGAVVDRWIAAYDRILGEVSERPDVMVHDLSLDPASAPSPPVEDFNPAPIVFDDEVDIAGLFRAQATATPTATAVCHGEARWDYARLDRASDAVAAALASQGVAPGARVGLCVSRGPAMVAGLFGILKAGAAYVPMDPDYPVERLRFMAEDSGAPLILSDGRVPDLGLQRTDIDEAMACEDAPPEPGVDPDRIAYIIYTSGSTGRPKGVLVRQRNLLGFLAWSRTAFSDAELEGVLGSASICFDFSVFEIFVPLCAGGTLVLIDNLLSLVEPPSAKVTMVSGVPSAMVELLRHATLPATARTVCVGGEAVHASLVEQLHAQNGVTRVLDVYGPTEATIFTTVGERTPGAAPSIGRPIAGWRVHIVDAQDRALGAGAEGELLIGGVGVSAGYIDRDDLTAARFVPDVWAGGSGLVYRTGDIARWRADGQIEYVGRADNQVKIRGFRIELGEIETMLESHASVDRCAVAVREAEPGDRQLVAYWQPQADSVAVEPAALRRYLRERLPLHMVPQQFVRVSDWPTLPNGKLDRAGLPNPFADRRAAQAAGIGAGVSASPESMTRLTRVWSEVLGFEVSARAHDTFLDLGGHSLLAVRAVTAVREQYDRVIPVRSMMLDSLAQLAVRLDAPPSAPAEPVPDDSPSTSPAEPPPGSRNGGGNGLISRLGFGKRR
ncbi:amino acid adenylation domain-containing protein [Salinisphaera sp. T31B1]|uniref:non-ribosomal peptide synthetase/type I polyketide synthase n=1 Tax=Salinisphaera sp. T31B1 TaxID=727963 RepID=UPI00333F5517